MKVPSIFRSPLSAGMLACIAAFYSPQKVQADNLVSNPGFEANTEGWSLYIPQDSKDKNCRISASADAPHSGAACLKMESDDFARFSVGPKFFKVQPRERYRVTAWVRGNAEIQPGTAGFAIRLTLHNGPKDTPGAHYFIGLDGRVLHGGAPVFVRTVPKEWTKLEAVVEIPEGIDNMGPGFFFWNAKGAVCVDDFAVEKVGADTPLTPQLAADYAPAPAEGPAASEADAFAGLNLDFPGMEAVKAAAAAAGKSGSLDEVKKAYLEFRRTKSQAKWLVSPADMPKMAKAQKDEAGDLVCEHKVSRLVYKMGPVDMGKDFDWTYNPLPKSDPSYTDEWTWHLGWGKHWDDLANAYWSTLDEKYAQAWVAQMLDFSRKCNRLNKPAPGKATLWRSLDASTRMKSAWPNAYCHFINSPSFTPEAHWIYLRMMLDHAIELKKILQVPGRTGNWISSECWGLYTIAVLFPELKEAPALREFAINRLLEEVNATVPPDGFEAELATGYHYGSLDAVAGPMRLATLNQLPVPEVFRSKVLSMYLAPVIVMDQSGVAIGTNDSAPVNAAVLARHGLQLMPDDPTLQWAASGGKEGKPLPATTMLPYAGFYAMRGGWKTDDAFLFFRAGPAGIAHEHEDMLEIVLRAWGKMLLFEPGTYMYDHSNWRRFAIGTASHNTIIVDGKWQHRGANKPPVTETVKNPWHVTPLFDFASGRYDGGYQTNVYNPKKQYAPEDWVGDKDFSVSHTRRVLFLKPYYALVLDTLDGTGKHQYDAHFHMDAPSAKLDPATQAITSQNSANQAQLALYPLDRDGLKADIVQGQEEPILGWFPGQHRPIPTARYSKTQEAPALFATFLYPFKGEAPRFEAKPLACDKAFWANALSTGREEAEVIVAKDGAARDWSLASALAGTFKTKSAGMVIRKIAQAQKTVLGGWELSSYSSKACSFTVSEPATLVWAVEGDRLLASNSGGKEVKLKITAPFAREAVLAPGAWVEISKKETKAATSPLDGLSPLEARPAADLADYKAYLEKFPNPKPAAEAQPIHLGMDSVSLPSSVSVVSTKQGAEGPAMTGWDEVNSVIAAKVNLPEPGWYHLKVRYCAQGNPVRSVMVGGSVPFTAAANVCFPSTIGDPPSDGWSNSANDWKEIVVGAPTVPGGWKFFLPGGESTIALRNEDGAGCNLNWLELVSVAK